MVPMAVPLLLFDSDLRRVWRDTGTLLIAFLVGAFSTIVGTLVAYPFLRNAVDWKVASALTARHIGGAINFVAVADTYQLSGTMVSAAIAADNIVVALYFAFLFSLSKPGESKTASVSSDTLEQLSSDTSSDSDISLGSLGTSLAISSCLVTVGNWLTKAFLPKGTSSLPLISMLTVSMATLFPKNFQRLRSTGTALGSWMMQLFFAVSGAAGSIPLVIKSAPKLFLFSMLQIAVHFVTLTTIGQYLLGLDRKELYLASNANVGGPTTAAAMAQAKEWNSLVLPSLLVGILGYATATAIAIAIGPLLKRLPVI